jgi:hypothetical protein
VQRTIGCDKIETPGHCSRWEPLGPTDPQWSKRLTFGLSQAAVEAATSLDYSNDAAP